MKVVNMRTFTDWAEQLDEQMQDLYSINIEAAGLDDEQLKEYFESGDAPHDVVDRLGEKYGLIPSGGPYR